MAISYNGLWKILIDKGMKKGDLKRRTGISYLLPIVLDLPVQRDIMPEEKRQITVIRSKNWLRSTRQKWMRRENVCMHR